VVSKKAVAVKNWKNKKKTRSTRVMEEKKNGEWEGEGKSIDKVVEKVSSTSVIKMG